MVLATLRPCRELQETVLRKWPDMREGAQGEILAWSARLAEIASSAEKARLAALADPSLFNRTNAALKTLLSSTALGSTRRDLQAACRCQALIRLYSTTSSFLAP